MARLQIGFADKVSSGAFSLPIRVTPIDVPLSRQTTDRARAWVRDLLGILSALGYGIQVHDDETQTEVRFRGVFIRVRL